MPRSDQSRHAWLRAVERPPRGSVFIGHDLVGTAKSMTLTRPSDTPIFDELAAKRRWHTMTWGGRRLVNIEFIYPDDTNPPWMKRYNDVDQP